MEFLKTYRGTILQEVGARVGETFIFKSPPALAILGFQNVLFLPPPNSFKGPAGALPESLMSPMERRHFLAVFLLGSGGLLLLLALIPTVSQPNLMGHPVRVIEYGRSQ